MYVCYVGYTYRNIYVQFFSIKEVLLVCRNNFAFIGDYSLSVKYLVICDVPLAIIIVILIVIRCLVFKYLSIIYLRPYSMIICLMPFILI